MVEAKIESVRCEKLHELFNSLKKFSFPFEKDENEIPLNGIYVLFEKGEFGHGGERIVRVGTHTGKDQLRSRLKQHFLNSNKNRSIFRTHVGRCFLNKENDDYVVIWGKNMTSRKMLEKFKNEIDKEKEVELEKQISDYIKENFSFVVFQVDDMDKRLELESKIIATISLCDQCSSSENWFGLNVPDKQEKIKKSGLWNIEHVFKNDLVLSGEEVEELGRLISGLF